MLQVPFYLRSLRSAHFHCLSTSCCQHLLWDMQQSCLLAMCISVGAKIFSNSSSTQSSNPSKPSTNSRIFFLPGPHLYILIDWLLASSFWYQQSKFEHIKSSRKQAIISYRARIFLENKSTELLCWEKSCSSFWCAQKSQIESFRDCIFERECIRSINGAFHQSLNGDFQVLDLNSSRQTTPKRKGRDFGIK